MRARTGFHSRSSRPSRSRNSSISEKNTRVPVLLYLFRRIEKSLHGQPAAIVLDEAWIMLGHETFRGKIREWLKVMRKANCLILMATQSLTDAANSWHPGRDRGKHLATKIFLPNAYAREEDASALYRRLGLNERQIQLMVRGHSQTPILLRIGEGEAALRIVARQARAGLRGSERQRVGRRHPPIGRQTRAQGLGQPLARQQEPTRPLGSRRSLFFSL